MSYNGLTAADIAAMQSTQINCNCGVGSSFFTTPVTTTTTTTTGINSNWNPTISTAWDSEKIKYSLYVGDTEITTEDIEFIQALRNANPDCAKAVAQMIQEFKDRNAWGSNQTLEKIKDDMITSKKEKVDELEKEIQKKKNKETRRQ